MQRPRSSQMRQTRLWEQQQLEASKENDPSIQREDGQLDDEVMFRGEWEGGREGGRGRRK
eukprot:286580-Hanusia_phi.AAC.2